MNILMLAPQPFLIDRGTPIATKFLAQALRSDGCTIDLVCFNEGEYINEDGINIIRVGERLNFRDIPPGFSAKKMILDVLMFFQTLRLLMRRRYDAVHAGEESGSIAMILCPLFRVPYIVDIDSDMTAQLVDENGWLRPFRSVLRWFELLPARFAKGAVVCSDLLADPVRKVSNAPVFVLKDVSLAGDTVCNDSDDPFEGLIPTGSRIVMYIGNLAPYQGIDLALDSFVYLSKRIPDARLVIIGGDTDSIEEYKEMARELGLEDFVRFLGPRPVTEIADWMQRADVLISPRTVGVNTPMKIYSYMDSGVPIVATDLLTHTQVLNNSLAALSPASPEPFSAAIAGVLEDPARARDLANAAREQVRREHSPEKFRADVTKIYSTLFESYPEGEVVPNA
jgi:glycosyltransferase involved in cell wall biosynthesis